MICQKCKVREATVTVTKLINNMQITMHLCPECSKRFTPGLQRQISGVNNILMKMMGSGDLINPDLGDERVCPECGMTFADFSKKGIIGCGKCYEIYHDKFKAILKRLHGNYQHIGLSYEDIKVDSTPGENTEVRAKKAEIKEEDNLREKIDNLKKALEDAVEREEYEEAAKIRDMIKIMEDGTTGGND